MALILSSSTIDKILEIYTKLENKLEIDKKNLENELEIDKRDLEIDKNLENCHHF